jgi:hypothetical protein
LSTELVVSDSSLFQEESKWRHELKQLLLLSIKDCRVREYLRLVQTCYQVD